MLMGVAVDGCRVTVGCSVKVRGVLADSPGKGQAKELKAEAVEILGNSDAEVRNRLEVGFVL